MGDLEESKVFQPAYVDPARCQALLWGGGLGRLQCGSKPEPGSDLCGAHRTCPHGRVTGPIPEAKLDQFRKVALGPQKPSKQWYSRHLMWGYAAEMRPDLRFLSERDEAGRWKLTDAEYERCLGKI